MTSGALHGGRRRCGGGDIAIRIDSKRRTMGGHDASEFDSMRWIGAATAIRRDGCALQFTCACAGVPGGSEWRLSIRAQRAEVHGIEADPGLVPEDVLLN